jgi:hypothetical protein
MKNNSHASNLDMVQSYLKGERPITQVGFREDEDLTNRAIGETWTDVRGKTWIKTEYGKSAATPVMDIIDAEINGKCSSCNCEIKWGSVTDKKMFSKTGKCLECQVGYENELRQQGKFEAYAQKKVYSNELAYMIEMKVKLKEALNYTKENKVLTYVNSNGMVEEWEGGRREELLKSLKKDHVRCLQEITRLTKQIADADAILNG